MFHDICDVEGTMSHKSLFYNIERYGNSCLTSAIISVNSHRNKFYCYLRERIYMKIRLIVWDLPKNHGLVLKQEQPISSSYCSSHKINGHDTFCQNNKPNKRSIDLTLILISGECHPGVKFKCSHMISYFKCIRKIYLFW